MKQKPERDPTKFRGTDEPFLRLMMIGGSVPAGVFRIIRSFRKNGW